MGVDASGGLEHGPFRLHPGLPQAEKRLLREEGGSLLTDGDRLTPIGEQGGGAVQEGEQVHVAMAAAVGAVHQPGLGGGAHLIHQGAGGLSGQSVPVLPGKKVPQDGPCPLPQLLHGVEPAGGAALSHSAADQTAPGGQAQILPAPPAPLRVQHIQIKQPAQRIPVLNGGTQLLDLPPGAPDGPQGLTARGAVDLLPGEGAQTGGFQGGVQAEQPLPEGAPDRWSVFYRPRDVHGEGDHRTAQTVQDLPLAAGPGLPGLQHLQ